jgi:hypothetical protein
MQTSRSKGYLIATQIVAAGCCEYEANALNLFGVIYDLLSNQKRVEMMKFLLTWITLITILCQKSLLCN